MVWTIEFDEAAVRRRRKMASQEARRIRDDMRDRIAPFADPRQTGKSLKGATLGTLWRYRVGDTRVICDLQDNRLVVLAVEIGHRRELYR